MTAELQEGAFKEETTSMFPSKNEKTNFNKLIFVVLVQHVSLDTYFYLIIPLKLTMSQ